MPPAWVMEKLAGRRNVGGSVAHAVGATVPSVVKTPTIVEREDLIAYLDKLDPYVEAMDDDADQVDRDHEKSLSKPESDMAAFKRRDNFIKTWLGWGGFTAKPENPGYYFAWQEMSKHIRSGEGAYTKVWPWLVFGPLAGVLLVPAVVAAAGTSAASRRGEQWNNIRDAHIRLGNIRNDLVDIGYKPSGGSLPAVPGDVGALGIGPLGDEKGKGGARAWFESIPWGWIGAGVILFGGAALLAQARGLFGPLTALRSASRMLRP